jgi:hypothetical protein
MYKTWCASHDDAEALSRDLEAHLNEYAEVVLSVSYSVTDRHHVLAVYKPVEFFDQARAEAAVTVAEQIIDQAQS